MQEETTAPRNRGKLPEPRKHGLPEIAPFTYLHVTFIAAGALPSISQITDNRCTDAGHVNLVIVIAEVFGKHMVLSKILEAFQAKASSNS